MAKGAKWEPQSEYECFHMSCHNCIYFQEGKNECGHPELADYPEQFRILR